MDGVNVAILGDDFMSFRNIAVLLTYFMEWPESIIRNLKLIKEASLEWIEVVHLVNSLEQLPQVIDTKVNQPLKLILHLDNLHLHVFLFILDQRLDLILINGSAINLNVGPLLEVLELNFLQWPASGDMFDICANQK